MCHFRHFSSLVSTFRYGHQEKANSSFVAGSPVPDGIASVWGLYWFDRYGPQLFLGNRKSNVAENILQLVLK